MIHKEIEFKTTEKNIYNEEKGRNIACHIQRYRNGDPAVAYISQQIKGRNPKEYTGIDRMRRWMRVRDEKGL